MSAPPSLADVLGKILEGIQAILYQVASSIADNANVIATVFVVGALSFLVARFGSRLMRSVGTWFRGFVA